jgi:RNA polymerase sigma-70 factor (ECF subfamily)
MGGDQTTQLQSLLDRVREGDDLARQELVGCAYERLRLLAKRIFHQDFPRLTRLHATDSILHETALRLLRALQEVQPSSVRDFLSFAAVQMRRVLLDLARRQTLADRIIRQGGSGRGDEGQSGQPYEAAIDTDDPARLAAWTEFHRTVDELSQQEREIFELIWYHGLTQAEVAKLLELAPKAVSRCWIRVRLKLADSVRAVCPDSPSPE